MKYCLLKLLGINVILHQVAQLLVWQLPLELQLEEYCSAWKEVLHFGTNLLPGERFVCQMLVEILATCRRSLFHIKSRTCIQLFCSFCATFSLNVLISISHGDTFGHIKLGSPGLVDFGTFSTVIYISCSYA